MKIMPKQGCKLECKSGIPNNSIPTALIMKPMTECTTEGLHNVHMGTHDVQ